MALKITEKKTADAQWFDYRENGETLASFLIRPADDKRYQVAVERNGLGVRNTGFDIADIGEDARLWVDKDAEAVARYLLADWKGLEAADGKPLPFTPDNAYMVLAKSSVGLQLWAWIKAQAEILQVQAEEATADLVKKP